MARGDGSAAGGGQPGDQEDRADRGTEWKADIRALSRYSGKMLTFTRQQFFAIRRRQGEGT
jgi:hypothetical protein